MPSPIDIATLTELTNILSDTSIITTEAQRIKYQTLLAKIMQDVVSDNLTSPANNKSLSQQGLLSLLTGYTNNDTFNALKSLFPTLSVAQAYKLLQVNAAGNGYQLAGPLAGRNLLINGNFDLWQRGTSGGPTSTSATLFAGDRWRIDLNGPTASYSLGQDYIDSTLSWYAVVNKTVAGGSNQFWLTQKIEEVRRLGGKTVCLSFWAKASTARSMIVYMSNYYGSGGSPLDNGTPVSYTVNLTTDWAKYTLVFTLPTTVGKTIGAGNYTELCFFDNTSDTFTWSVGRVQLEIGSVPTAFEFRQLADEALLCQRYFEKSYDPLITPGTASSNNGPVAYSNQNSQQNKCYVPFKVLKRWTPSMVVYSPNSGTAGKFYDGISTDKNGTAANVGTAGFHGTLTSTSTLCDLYFHYTADAEL